MVKRGVTRVPRTATGKKGNPDLLESAERASREGYRERTEAGHRAAGRTPPSRDGTAIPPLGRRALDRRCDSRPSARHRRREAAPAARRRRADFTRTDPWRVMRIMGEFIEGFDNLARVEKGVSIFGSARTAPDDPQYQAAQETARLLAEAGFAIITGAGPGIMEAANKGAQHGRRPLDRLQHRAALRAGREPVRRYARQLPLLLRAEDDVHQVLERVHHLPGRLRHARRSCSRR